MSTPKPFLRRAKLIEWLADHGFTPGAVDQMIRDGIIPKHPFNPPRPGKRAYYHRDTTARSLGISLPAHP